MIDAHVPWPVRTNQLAHMTADALRSEFPAASGRSVNLALHGAEFNLAHVIRRKGACDLDPEPAIDTLGDAFADRLDELQRIER